MRGSRLTDVGRGFSISTQLLDVYMQKLLTRYFATQGRNIGSALLTSPDDICIVASATTLDLADPLKHKKTRVMTAP